MIPIGEGHCSRIREPARPHTVGGFGTNRGPDLSAVGARRGAGYLYESLIDPGATLPEGLTVLPVGFSDYLPVRVVTRTGAELNGYRVNEDSYTLQIRDDEGRILSLRKLDLDALEKQFDASLMPNFRSTFSRRRVGRRRSLSRQPQGAVMKRIALIMWVVVAVPGALSAQVVVRAPRTSGGGASQLAHLFRLVCVGAVLVARRDRPKHGLRSEGEVGIPDAEPRSRRDDPHSGRRSHVHH